MTTKNLLTAALGVSLALSAAAGPAATASATAPSPNLPQTADAHSAATWLVKQLPTESLSDTANSILALAASGVDPAGAATALSTLGSNLSTFVTNTSYETGIDPATADSDDAGELALLILDARALGVSPTDFAGTNLVSRLLATQQTSGGDAGLFGDQDPTYNGAYRQGLALVALAAAGITSSTSTSGTAAAISSAEHWLTAQQCPDGGWTSYVTVSNPCTGDPAEYAGPDTNSTALAIEGLAAQGGLTSSIKATAMTFVEGAQDSDGGWGYEPNASDAPGSSDPDSTSVVVQALLSAGEDVTSPAFTQSGGNPVTALDSFRITHGKGMNAIGYPGVPGGDTLATEQEIPALEGVAFPLPLAISSTPANPTVGVPYTAHLTVSGATGGVMWKVASGTLPSGLKLSGAKATISGTPTTAGSSSVILQATSSTGSELHYAWQELTITVHS